MKNYKNYIHPELERLETRYSENGYLEKNEFSKSPCDCCGDWLAGERYEVKAIRNDRKARGSIAVMRPAFAVCPDCVERWQ